MSGWGCGELETVVVMPCGCRGDICHCGFRAAMREQGEPGTQDGVQWVDPELRERYATSGVGWPD